MRRERISQLIPPFAGADSVKGDVDSLSYRLDFKEDASRLKPGCLMLPALPRLNASLKFMEEIGPEKIYQEAWKVSKTLIQVLKDLNFHLAPCAHVRKDPVADRLFLRGK